MIASLTRAAAAEIAGRGLDLPRRAVGTLHAHAYRALDRPALAETPEGLAAWNDWLDREGRLGAWKIDPGSGVDLDWAPAEQRARRKGEGLLAALQTYRARRSPREFWRAPVVRFAEAWEAWKAEAQRVDFTDLIERALRATAAAPGEPAIIMLDEAQDLSRLELDLARKWAAAAEQIVIVGDPWQGLYSWRGTDPEAMMQGEAASEHVLEQSYRVPAAVHEYAVEWLARGPQPLTVEYRPRLRDPEQPHLGPAIGAVESCPHVWKDPGGVIARVLDDLDRGMSVMVLASCGYMLVPLIAGLRRLGVPFHNPYRVNNGAWNPLRGAGRLLAYLRPDEDTWAHEARAWTWEDLRKWIEPIEAKGRLAKGAKQKVKAKAKAAEESGAEEETVPLAEVMQLFATLEVADQAAGLDVEWWADSLLSDARKRAAYPLAVRRERGGAALRESPRLVVGTVHSVKGGEASSVYIFPDLSQAGWVSGWENPSSRAPIYRLFYVAATRARDKLTICAPASGLAASLPKP